MFTHTETEIEDWFRTVARGCKSVFRFVLHFVAVEIRHTESILLPSTHFGDLWVQDFG
ncbi:hypothetical protein Hanom_Chr15g01376701 [Helianthus anomalus]